MPGRHVPKVILSSKPNKKIYNVEVGDKLLTFDKEKNLVETEITNIIVREVNSWLRIKIEKHEYYVTEEHPFFTTQGIKKAKDLQIGNEIYHSNFKDKLSFRITGIKNPMKDNDIKKKSIENTNYSISGKKISNTIKKKQEEGTYISPYNSLSKKQKEELRKKQSLPKMGDKNPNWSGGSKTPNYDKLKQDIKEGKIKECSICKRKKSLDVHHKDSNRKNDSSENLKVECESCHYSTHEIGYNFWKNNRKDGKKLSAINGLKILSIKEINRNNYPPSLRPNLLKVYNLSCSPYNSFLLDYMWVHNCDTPYAQDETAGQEMSIDDVLKKTVSFGNTNITITGGEPLLQSDIIMVAKELFMDKFQVSIETNGSIYMHPYPGIHYVADWKGPSSGMSHYKWVKNFENLGRESFIKFVIADWADFEDALYIVHLFRHQGCRFAFSPSHDKLDPKILVGWMDKVNMLKKKGVVISLQLHKFLDVL
jgi:7-carboxy-7-deazaguanine synthase